MLGLSFKLVIAMVMPGMSWVSNSSRNILCIGYMLMWWAVPPQCLLPAWLQVTHMALGVPRESYTSPRCIPLLLLFHYKLYSMFASMGLGSWAFLLLWWSFSLQQALSPRGMAFQNAPGFLPNGGSLAQLPSFLDWTLLLFFCSNLRYNGLPPIPAANEDFNSLEKGRYIGLNGVSAIAAVPSFRQHHGGGILRL